MLSKQPNLLPSLLIAALRSIFFCRIRRGCSSPAITSTTLHLFFSRPRYRLPRRLPRIREALPATPSRRLDPWRHYAPIIASGVPSLPSPGKDRRGRSAQRGCERRLPLTPSAPARNIPGSQNRKLPENATTGAIAGFRPTKKISVSRLTLRQAITGSLLLIPPSTPSCSNMYS